MYPILHQLLSDKKSDVVFTCFGTWHLLYMALIFLAILGLLLRLRENPQKCGSGRLTAPSVSRLACIWQISS